MKEFIKKNGLILFIILITVIRVLLTYNIPITAFPSQVYDDDMMVEMAINIRAGEWLGDYTSNTLVKGPFFPFLLAVINFLGFSYINTMNIIYALACMYFIYTIKDVFKSKISIGVIYTILLFNPVSFAFWTLQRVYRNGITLAQVLIIIGSMFACYRRKDEKCTKMIPFAVLGGLTLASLWLTREDGIWIIPFVLTVIAIIIVYTVLHNKEEKKIMVKKIAVSIIPMLLLIVSLNIVRAINYHYYGVYEYNEINDGYFGKVIKTIYSIETNEDIQYVTATRNKLKMLYENSETLKSIENKLEESMNAWDGTDRKPGDTQVEDGWFWWALKGAGENAEIYKDAKTANEFYKKIYNELQEAIKNGKLNTHISMPSNLMSPWKLQYFKELPYEMAKTSWYIARFYEVETVNRASEDNSRKYNAITNDLSVLSSNDGNVDELTKYTDSYVKRLNNIGYIYKKLGFVLTIISLICYVFLTVVLIMKKEKILDLWLLLTGIGCSLLVLIAGVSYNQITACFSRYYMYLSGAYPLLIAFWGISMSKTVEIALQEKLGEIK